MCIISYEERSSKQTVGSMWFISRAEQSEIKELIRSGRYLKTFFLGHKSSSSNLQEVGQRREETILANSRLLSQTKIQKQNG